MTSAVGWTRAFAAGLALRPLLIVPMAPSGPLSGSNLLGLGLVLLIAVHVGIAAGVLAGSRIATAFGLLTVVVGVGLAALGAYAGLPMPWPLALIGYNIALGGVGLRAWPGPS